MTSLSRNTGEVAAHGTASDGDRAAAPQSDSRCAPQYPQRSAPRPFPQAGEVNFGPTLLPDGHTRFRLWAPAQESVSLAFESDSLVPMQRSPDGWFEIVAPAPPGTLYRFRLADGMLVPDPASHFQPDDVHGPGPAACHLDPAIYFMAGKLDFIRLAP